MKIIKKNFTALIVICLTVSSLWFTNRAVTPEAASWEEVVSEAKTGNYDLITTDELRQLYFGKNAPLIVDTRQEWEFRSGHIKGAVNFPMEPTWLSRWQKKTSLEKFLGPGKDITIIFY